MRNVFFTHLHEQMKSDERIFLLCADMGLGLVDKFQADYPTRFLNVGISEQNMIAVAGGLCNLGYRPYCYTISNFLIHRCFEQIRNDVCLHNYPITLVGTSTGYDNGMLGATHQVIDDIGCLKVFPNMNIYSPSSASFIPAIFQEIVDAGSPAYIRIGKGDAKVEPFAQGLNGLVHDEPEAKTVLVTHGAALANCLKANALGANCAVYCFNKVKPIAPAEASLLFGRFKRVIVVEDHFVTSGLYDSLCRCAVEQKAAGVDMVPLGPPEVYEKVVGDADYFAERYGFTPEKIARRVQGA